jgi:hypothetical protein
LLATIMGMPFLTKSAQQLSGGLRRWSSHFDARAVRIDWLVINEKQRFGVGMSQQTGIIRKAFDTSGNSPLLLCTGHPLNAGEQVEKLLHIPDVPGVGLEWNEEAVAASRANL